MHVIGKPTNMNNHPKSPEPLWPHYGWVITVACTVCVAVSLGFGRFAFYLWRLCRHLKTDNCAELSWTLLAPVVTRLKRSALILGSPRMTAHFQNAETLVLEFRSG